MKTQLRAGVRELPVEPELQRYVLYPYLEAAAILGTIGRPDRLEAGLSAARQFVATHRQSAVADDFVRELLLVLSDREAWEAYVEFYQAGLASEARECEYLRARVSLGLTDGLAPLIEQRWLTPRRLNSACEPAFEWLRERGVLDDALTAQRVERLLESGQTQFARIIAQRLPAQVRQEWIEWSQMLDDPLSAIDSIIDTGRTPNRADALRSTWSRASTSTPGEAFARLDGLLQATAQDVQLRESILRDLALGLAWDRRSESLEVFARIPWADHDDYTLGWLTRAALWNAQWSTARRALSQMSAEAADESAWAYWHGRVAELTGESDAAGLHYARLQGRDNFYSALAAARTAVPVLPADSPAPVADSTLEALSRLPGFRRAQELLAAGERVLATREWRYATADLEREELVAAVALAHDWGWYDVAVAAATQAQVFYDYRRLYPRPFEIEIERAADAHSVEPTLLSALIRQESMFRADAVSSAGAMGLAQLQLGTARQTARRLGLTRPEPDDLFEPARNTLLGAATLRDNLGGFAGQLPVALAAYNAGPAAAARWLPQESLDSDIWIENIPYNETRDYVHRVVWNDIVYAWLAGDGEPVDTRHLIGTVTPVPAN